MSNLEHNSNINENDNINLKKGESSSKIININSKAKKSKDLELQINFKFDNSEEQEQKYISMKKKQKDSEYYKDIDFLNQSNYRFVLYPTSQPSITNSLKFDFKDIFLVKWYNQNNYLCPICLHNISIPIITKCGHVFCWVCIVSYYNYTIYSSFNDKKILPKPICPLCKVNIVNLSFDNIKFCEIVHSKHYFSLEDSEFNEEEGNRKDSNDFFESSNVIIFNLVTRSNSLIYNVNKDQDFSKFTSKLHNHLIAPYDLEQSAFSSIFKISFDSIDKKYKLDKDYLTICLKHEQNQPDEVKDNRKIESIVICLSDLEGRLINNMIEREKLTTKEIQNTKLTQINDSFDYEILKKLKYFYQEENGDIFFLHPICYSMLLFEYQNVANLPSRIIVRL